MIPTLLALPLYCTAPPVTASLPLVQDDPSPERIAEDLEVLRRLLVQAIGDDPNAPASPFYVAGGVSSFSLGHSRAVPHSRAFHIPGQGAFVCLDAQLPVVPADESPKDQELAKKSEAEEEWDRVRREVRTGISSRRRVYSDITLFGTLENDDRTWKIDPKAMAEVEDTVLQTLGRHAGRIEGLRSGETITVALHLSGSEAGAFVVRTETDEESDEDCTVGWLGGALAARRAPARRVIVQMDLASLRRADLNGDPEGARRLAQIHRY